MAKKVAEAEPVEGRWALPDGWRWERLGSVGQWGSGGTPDVKNARYYGGDIPWFRSGELLDRPLNDSEIKISEEGLRGSSAKLIDSGAVFVAMYGATVGKLAISTGVCATNQAIAFCLPAPDRMTPRYLFYYLLSIRRHLRDQAQGGAQPNISQTVLKEQIIPVPPVDQQRAIVARIDELFAEVDDGEAALARARHDLATWRKALLKVAVTGELTADWRAANPPIKTGVDLLHEILAERRARWEVEPRNAGKRYKEPPAADTTNLPALPAGWSWASLAQIAYVSGGLTVDAKRKPVDPIELPYMRVANVQRGHLNLEAMKTVTIDRSAVEALALASGDILLNEGGDRDKIGRGWVYEGQLPVCLHQNHVFKARPAHDAVSPFLVSMYLNELGRRFFIDQGKQTTNLASISLSKVSTAPIPIPPAAEAAEILRVYAGQSLPGVGVDIDGMRTAATTLRQSILAAAFRGELA